MADNLVLSIYPTPWKITQIYIFGPAHFVEERWSSANSLVYRYIQIRKRFSKLPIVKLNDFLLSPRKKKKVDEMLKTM